MQRLSFRSLIVLITLVSQGAQAQDIGDFLKSTVEDYLEKKAEESGLAPATSVNNPDPQNVTLKFTGSRVEAPDVFSNLHSRPGSSPASPTLSVMKYAPSFTLAKPLPNVSETTQEKACFNRVQNKIAWDYNGHKSWSSDNIKKLCKGTRKSTQPPSCFSRAMFSGPQWGKNSTHQMNWTLAVQLCAGTNDSNKKINCLKQKIAQKQSLTNAVKSCAVNSSSNLVYAVPAKAVVASVYKPLIVNTKVTEDACIKNVQGKLAWDAAKRNKKWATASVKRLCKGTKSASAPASCFYYAMHQTAAWGKKSNHVMNWNTAIDLCEGTSNANATKRCFRNAIRAGKTVNAAVGKCDV